MPLPTLHQSIIIVRTHANWSHSDRWCLHQVKHYSFGVGFVSTLDRHSVQIEWSFFDLSFVLSTRALDLQLIHRERESRGPSLPPVELEPAISGSLMEIRSKAATSGAVRSWPAWRRRWRRRERRCRGDGGSADDSRDAGGVLPVTRCAPSRSARV